MKAVKKHDVVLLLFVALCLGVAIFSAVSNWDSDEFSKDGGENSAPESGYTSFFKKTLYFRVTGMKPQVQLEASQLSLNAKNKWIYFLDPNGRAFSQNGDPIDYQALKGSLDQASERLALEENVVVETEHSKIKAARVSYVANQDLLTCSGQVDAESFNPETGDKVIVQSEQLLSFPRKREATYNGNVVGKIQRKRAYEESITFSSANLRLDLNAQHVTLEGDVEMKKQQLTASARSGEIFLENYNKKLKYFALYDDVKLREKVLARGERLERKAFAEKLEGVMSEDRIILTGFPKVLQRGDVIKGNRITLRENNEVVEVEDANTNFKLR